MAKIGCDESFLLYDIRSITGRDLAGGFWPDLNLNPGDH